MAKNNIITATKELVKEFKGDVPEGETPPTHNWVIHTYLKGVRAQLHKRLTLGIMEEGF